VRRIVLDTSLNRVIPAEPAVYRLDAPDLTLTVRLKLPAGLFQDGALGEVATSVRVSPWAPDFPWGSVETVAETIDRMRVTRGLEPLTESKRETVAERVSKAICWSLREFHQQLEEDETPAWTSLFVCLKEASLEQRLRETEKALEKERATRATQEAEVKILQAAAASEETARKTREETLERATEAKSALEKRVEQLESSLKTEKEERTRLLTERSVLKEELGKQGERVKELEKNKLTRAQVERIRQVVNSKKQLKTRVEELEKEKERLEKLVETKGGREKAREGDTGEETQNLEIELLTMKDKLQTMKKEISQGRKEQSLPRNVTSELPTSVPKKNVKRGGADKEESKRRKVEETEDNHCQTQ